MREFINLIQSLSEGVGKLSPGEFKNRPNRYETFINKIKKRKCLYRQYRQMSSASKQRSVARRKRNLLGVAFGTNKNYSTNINCDAWSTQYGNIFTEL